MTTENDHKFLERYEKATGDATAQAELQAELGHKNWSSVRNYASDVRRRILKEGIQIPHAVNPTHKPGRELYSLTIPQLSGITTCAILNDAQVPYHDPVTFSLVYKFLGKIQPAYIILNGDWFDFYQLSRFCRDPIRKINLQSDINICKETLKSLRQVCPNSTTIWVLGNHEDRLRKYLWESAEELAFLDNLSFDELFGLKELDIKIASYDKGILINNVFMVHHGDVVRKHSGWTAKAMFEKRGGNGICGHSHRGGNYRKRDTFNEYGWWENYCLCSLDPEYVDTPDWQQGFSLVHWLGNRFMVEPMGIVKHAFIYGGEIWKDK